MRNQRLSVSSVCRLGHIFHESVALFEIVYGTVDIHCCHSIITWLGGCNGGQCQWESPDVPIGGNEKYVVGWN